MKKNTLLRLGLAIATGIAAALPGLLMAVEPRTIETNWTPQWYAAKSGAASSTHAVTGTGVSWLVLADGGDATITLWTTTQTYRTGDPVMVPSSTIYVLNGKPLSGTFTSLSLNPRLVWQGVGAGTTAYTYLEYGEARK